MPSNFSLISYSTRAIRTTSSRAPRKYPMKFFQLGGAHQAQNRTSHLIFKLPDRNVFKETLFTFPGRNACHQKFVSHSQHRGYRPFHFPTEVGQGLGQVCYIVFRTGGLDSLQASKLFQPRLSPLLTSPLILVFLVTRRVRHHPRPRYPQVLCEWPLTAFAGRTSLSFRKVSFTFLLIFGTPAELRVGDAESRAF